MWISRFTVLLGCVLLMSGCAKPYFFTFGNTSSQMVDYDDLVFPEATVWGPKVWGPHSTKTQARTYVDLPPTLTIGWSSAGRHHTQQLSLDRMGSANHLIFVVTEGNHLEVFFSHDVLQPNVSELVRQRYADDD